MIKGQISIFDKPLIKLTEDCTSLNPLLSKNSIHDVYLEKSEHYIIYLDKVFYGVFKYNAREC